MERAPSMTLSIAAAAALLLIAVRLPRDGTDGQCPGILMRYEETGNR
jgi:hypothetical protein